MLHFESKTRYYRITLSRDLFGHVIITRTWGGKNNTLGGIATESAGNLMARLRELCKERRQHGYALIFSPRSVITENRK